MLPFRRAYTNALCRRADLILFQSRLEANPAITETPLNWLLEAGPLQVAKLDCKQETVLSAPPAPQDVSMAATRCRTAFCTSSKARTSICRTRSRETPNFSARSSSAIG